MRKRIIAVVLPLLAPGLTAAQSAVVRTPNLSGAWVAPAGVVQFNFLHRFDVSPAPVRKVTNSPTFLVAAGVGRTAMVGFNYATASDLVRSYPNEWEFFARATPLRQEGVGLDASLQLGYNLATESVDGQLLVARGLGPLRLFAAARGFSNGYHAGEARYALAGGATLALTPGVALAGDVAVLLDASPDEEPAWGAGLQLGVPLTPHTMSLHVTNVNTGTLQGTSRASGLTRFGFEYTMPLTLRRYVPRGGAEPVAAEPARPAVEPGDTVRADIRDFRFVPQRLEVVTGTTIVWTNADAVVHTVTADDGGFDSGSIEPGASWSRTFTQPGTHPFHCTPHPFMTGTIVVVPEGGTTP